MDQLKQLAIRFNHLGNRQVSVKILLRSRLLLLKDLSSSANLFAMGEPPNDMAGSNHIQFAKHLWGLDALAILEVPTEPARYPPRIVLALTTTTSWRVSLWLRYPTKNE